MNNKQRILMGVIIGVIVVLSFVSGLFIGQKNATKNDLAINKVCSQTFYAKIESIKLYNDESLHINVKGLEVNDINYRGNFTFKVDDNMDITWRGEKIKIQDLRIGSNISITFTNESIVSISPTPLNEVVKVQILDDKYKENVINNKATTIDIGTTGVNIGIPSKKYTLNQEEMYTIFNIIDNLTFTKETCDGLSSYYISYNSEEKENFVNYGIETYESGYHITSNGKGEAILSKEQTEELKKILKKI